MAERSFSISSDTDRDTLRRLFSHLAPISSWSSPPGSAWVSFTINSIYVSERTLTLLKVLFSALPTMEWTASPTADYYSKITPAYHSDNGRDSKHPSFRGSNLFWNPHRLCKHLDTEIYIRKTTKTPTKQICYRLCLCERKRGSNSEMLIRSSSFHICTMSVESGVNIVHSCAFTHATEKQQKAWNTSRIPSGGREHQLAHSEPSVHLPAVFTRAHADFVLGSS